jgi:hypothetical protein
VDTVEFAERHDRAGKSRPKLVDVADHDHPAITTRQRLFPGRVFNMG